MTATSRYDVIVVGAGAAGLMTAIEAGKRGRKVLLVERGEVAGGKIGRGDGVVTNLYARPQDGLAQYIRSVDHFPRAALMRFTPERFTGLLDAAGIAWEEGPFGQVLADGMALAAMLAGEAARAGVELRLGATVETAGRTGEGFAVEFAEGKATAESLVLASGGLSAPGWWVTDLGYRAAGGLGLGVSALRPGLTDFIFAQSEMRGLSALVGSEVVVQVKCGQQWFEGPLRFTGPGIGGPALRQISSYWHPGEALVIDLAPGWDAWAALSGTRDGTPGLPASIALTLRLQRSLAEMVVAAAGAQGPVGGLSDGQFRAITRAIHDWRLTPITNAGFDAAETTLGGVALDAIDPISMEAVAVPGLFVVGELLDITGWLGGYNLHWAWASGWTAGQTC